MITVEFYNSFEVFPICGSGSSESISFNEFRADLSDGFRQQALYGSLTGLRAFTIQLKTLAGGSYDNTINLNGVLMNPATYVWDLFQRTKVSGVPFIAKSPINDQYYLVEFAESSLSYERALQKLFSTGLNLRQVRLPNVSVFDVSKYPEISHWYKTPIASATDNAGLPGDVWLNSMPGGNFLIASPGVTYQTNEQNGKAVVRLDTTGGADYLATDFIEPDVFYEAYLVMKVRESTFSHDDGIISNGSGTTGTPALLGSAGTSKFYNLGIGSPYTYKKNGVEFPESNQQAPMNEFGLVHIRNAGGWTMEQGLIFGVDRLTTFPNRKADVDFGEIIVARELLPESTANEITEYLINGWSI